MAPSARRPRSGVPLALAFLATVAMAVAPAAGAQAPVERCAHQCAPQDPDVNQPPVRAEGPVNLLLFAHWHDILNRAPLNTQRPDPGVDDDLNHGYATPTLVLRTPCAECNVHFQNNVLTMFTLPALVDPGEPTLRFDPDRLDPAVDLHLGPDPIVAYAYLSAHAVPTQSSEAGPGALTNAGVLPAVTLEAVWETGLNPGQGLPLAHGASEAVTVLHAPGSDPVYEVPIPLERDADFVPRGAGSMLHVRLRQLDGDVLEAGQSDWRLRSGPDFPWRLIVPVENPLEGRELAARVVNDTVVVRWAVRSPLGAYDVDASSFRLTARDASGAARWERGPDAIERPPAPIGHLRSLRPEWVAPLGALRDSEEWTFEVSALNRQGTFRLEQATTARLFGFEAAESVPGLGAVAATLAFLASALALPRRPR